MPDRTPNADVAHVPETLSAGLLLEDTSLKIFFLLVPNNE